MTAQWEAHYLSPHAHYTAPHGAWGAHYISPHAIPQSLTSPIRHTKRRNPALNRPPGDIEPNSDIQLLRLIWHQMGTRLVPNYSEKFNQKQNVFCL